MSVLLGVILLFAVLSLVAAAVQASAMLRLAPAHEQLDSFMPLGWWKFGQLERKAGPAAAPHLLIYKRAVIAFVVFLLLGLALSGWTVNRQQGSGSASLEGRPLIQTADLYLFSRVALVPGAPTLRS
jgi:hypothetical protein